MRVPAAALAALLLALPAVAQTTAPSPTAQAINAQDRQFMAKDAEGGLYEIAIARLAQQRSSRDDVKAYAARIVADHTTYNDALQALARSKGITLPMAMTSEDQARLALMESATGAFPDAMFIQEATRINEEDKKAAGEEKARTSDADIKAFLAKFESMDAEHERMASALRQ